MLSDGERGGDMGGKGEMEDERVRGEREKREREREKGYPFWIFASNWLKDFLSLDHGDEAYDLKNFSS